MPKRPVMVELVIRRGREWWEWRHRDGGDDSFRTTKVPTHPLCGMPRTSCKWCSGLLDPAGNVMRFPLRSNGVEVRHVVTPPQAAHLVAFEWNDLNPGQPIRVGWILTDEEIEAGRTGMEWPSDV